jgi:sodium-dependent phosphate cotransporter
MEKLKEFSNKYPNLIAGIKLAVFLYLFFLSLELMGDSMKLFGKDFAKTLLATSIIQSSSSTTSIVVGMVAGGALNIPNAIPIIMGANIGTSITNTIASLPQINRSNEFRRAFAAATVHDFFNFLAVIVIFPIQYYTNFLGKASAFLAEEFQNVGGLKFLSPVKEITKPVAKFIIEQIKFGLGDGSAYKWISLGVALLMLFVALKYMTESLKVLIISKAKAWFDEFLFKTAPRAMVVGLLLTILVQSSSITTSLVVPMAGAGLLSLIQIFPYTLGSNIGTTVTAILAALLTGNPAALTVAFAHLLFNISGIIFWWPLKRVPIFLAEKFSEYSIKSKLIPVAYVIVLFFIIPVLVIYLVN